MNVLPNPALGERNVFFNRSLDHQLEVALFDVLDSDEQLIQFVVDKPIQVLHNVGVV